MKNIKTITTLLISIALTLTLTACSSKNTGSAWTDEHGIKVIEAQQVEFETATYDDAGQMKMAKIKVTPEISQHYSMREGYKEVTCVFNCDLSEVESGYKVAQWQSAFDKYTGTSFEFEGEPVSQDQGSKGKVVVGSDEEAFDISMEYGVEKAEEARLLKVTIKVTCPEEYNGTVFQIGYSDKEINEANAKIDYISGMHTIDELPGFDTNGHQYFYFSDGSEKWAK